MMRKLNWVGILMLLAVEASGLRAQDYGDADGFQARVWLDRGDSPLLQRGDRVRIYYRASSDAYVAIFHIDTDGTVRLLSPRTPDDDHYVRGGRDYRLLFPQSPYWFVDEYPGKGYFFIVASQQPFDFSSFAHAPYERGWDLSQVGRTVYQDPYVAIDEYVAKLVPDWQSAPYALDFLSYDVGEAHEYPRFLCYDCHGYRAYSAWNPYTYACSSFRVVIWDDPYFYPAYRYRGTRVVFAQPARGLARYELKERAVGESWMPLTRTRQPPLRRSVEYAEPAVAAPEMPEFVPPRRRVTPTEQLRRDAPGGNVAEPRAGRPVSPDPGSSAGSPPRRVVGPGVVAPPTDRSGTPATARPGRTAVAPPSRPGTTSSRAGERPVLQRRPSAPPASTPARGSTPTRGSGAAPTRAPVTAKPKPPSRPGGGDDARNRSGNAPAPGARPSRPSSSGARPPARPPDAKPRKPGGGSLSDPRTTG